MPKEDISFLFHLDLHLTRRAKDNEKFARPRILICRNPVLKVLKFFFKSAEFLPNISALEFCDRYFSDFWHIFVIFP